MAIEKDQTMNRYKLKSAIVLGLLLSLGLLVGCDDNDPVEQFGENVEELGDDVQEVTDDTRREIEDIAD